MRGRLWIACATLAVAGLCFSGRALAQTATDRDRDGVADLHDLCPDEAETHNRVADSDGCPDADADGDRVADEYDVCRDAAETFNHFRDADGCPDRVESQFRQLLWGILFETGQASLGPEAEARVREASNYFQAHPEIGPAVVLGYADNRGSSAANQALSRRRAETVRDALVRSGVGATRISALGRGERAGSDPRVRQANRRADFAVRVERPGMQAGGNLRPYLGQYTGGRGVDLHVGARSDDVYLTVRPGAPRWLGPAGTTLECYELRQVGDRLLAHCEGVIKEVTVVVVRDGAASRGWISQLGSGHHASRSLEWSGAVSCDAGFHLCAGGCVADDDPVGCGLACAVCPATDHGQATCQSGVCALECDAEHHLCANRCVANDDPAHCGGACEPCADPGAGAESTCQSGQCGARCREGHVRRGAACEPLLIEELVAGTARTFARLSDGTVRAWGWNRDGQLGDGSDVDRPVPVAVAGLDGVSSLSAGYYHTCASRVDGRVLCWGQNDAGALGTGQQGGSLVPVPTSLSFEALRVDSGAWRSCATSTAGRVWCWGSRVEGDADFAAPNPSVAAWFRPLTEVAALALGSTSACALGRDGAARCWGQNRDGEVGDGTTSARGRPVPLPELTAVRELAVGRGYGNSTGFACALLEAGTVRCWGANDWGQLGDGTTTDRTSPVEVPGLTGVAQIALGSTHACARMNDGTVRCWGGNASGQLGDGTTTPRPAPSPVGGLSGVVQVVTGSAHTCALLRNNAVYCWGCNETGELGDGTQEDRASPVRVRGFGETGGGAFVAEAPTRQQAQAALAVVADAVAACGTGRAETISVEVELAGSGEVSAVRVPAPYGASPARACIETAVRRVRTAPFRRAALRVRYPYRLRGSVPVAASAPSAGPTLAGAGVASTWSPASGRVMLGFEGGAALAGSGDHWVAGGLRLEYNLMDDHPVSLVGSVWLTNGLLLGAMGGLRWRFGGTPTTDNVGFWLVAEAGAGAVATLSRTSPSPASTLGLGINIGSFGDSWGGIALLARWVRDYGSSENAGFVLMDITVDLTRRSRPRRRSDQGDRWGGARAGAP